MQNFTLWLRRWYPLLVEIMIVCICGYFIFHSDRFQEKISPKKYWLCKVKELEGDLRIDRWRVRSLEISLQREKIAGQYNIQAAIDHAKSFGEDVESVAQNAVEEYEDALHCLEKNLEDSKKELEHCQTKLVEAKMKLKKTRG